MGDYYRFASMLLNKGVCPLTGKRALSEDAVRGMTEEGSLNYVYVKGENCFGPGQSVLRRKPHGYVGVGGDATGSD